MRLRTPGSLHSCGALFCALLAGAASAHPGLEHDLARVTAAIDESPQPSDLLVERARLHRLRGDFQASLADLDHVAALATPPAIVHLERGLTLAVMNRDDEAEAELDRYLAEGGEASAALATRGRIHARNGRFDLAIEDFTTALARKPDVELYLARGRLLESIGRIDEAADGYREGLACLDGAVLIRIALIRVESARDRHGEALALIDEVLGSARVKTEWYLRRAEVLSEAGKDEEAAEALERASVEADRALARRATPLNRSLKSKVLKASGGFLAHDRNGDGKCD